MNQTAATWADFDQLLGALAAAWERADAERAAGVFTEDAVYMEPPDRQLFRGRAELVAYFSPLEAGTYLDVQGTWFDQARQRGAVGVTPAADGQRATRRDRPVEVGGDRQRRVDRLTPSAGRTRLDASLDDLAADLAGAAAEECDRGRIAARLVR